MAVRSKLRTRVKDWVLVGVSSSFSAWACFEGFSKNTLTIEINSLGAAEYLPFCFVLFIFFFFGAARI